MWEKGHIPQKGELLLFQCNKLSLEETMFMSCVLEGMPTKDLVRSVHPVIPYASQHNLVQNVNLLNEDIAKTVDDEIVAAALQVFRTPSYHNYCISMTCQHK